MTNLVVCCDGTWNEPDNKDHGRPAPTNVYRLFSALDTTTNPARQKSYYHPGVGTEGGIFERLLGGAFGEGLDKNIMSAYHWLAEHFQDGDSIFLFGFSRGAYTARSVAGMICRCGLLDLNGVNVDEGWKRVNTVYREGYRHRRDRAAWASDWPFHQPGSPCDLPIHFVGVWDTVGALGIPDDLALLNEFDRKNYRFHDTKLHPNIRHARHAVAIDERRASFYPTLWSEIPAGCDAKELWFPGVHCDVGGGYAETGLSDGALQWMIDEATGQALTQRLAVNPAMTGQIRPNPQDELHDSLTLIFKEMRSQPRAIPMITDSKNVHRSTMDRHKTPPITQAPFHPSTVLAVNGQASARIYAKERWNDTGLYLEAGTYELTATGQWLDASIPFDPNGVDGGKFHLGKVAYVVGSVLGQIEKGYQAIRGNKQADFKGTKRIEGAPWVALIGVVANQTGVKPDGTPLPHQIFVIGGGPTALVVEKPGYLHCFANDAWDFYFNNSGSVELMVTRKS